MLGYETVDMAHTLFFQDLVDSNQNTSFLHITKTIIDGCAEKLHRRTEIHISIHQRGNVVAQFTYLAIENTIVCTEVIFGKERLQLTLWSFYFQWFHRDNKILLIIEMLLEEIENHVATTANIRRIHCHLAKEIFQLGIEHSKSSQTIPQVVERKDALAVHAHILIFQ